MSNTAIQTSFIPFDNSILTNDGEKLEILFTTQEPVYDSANPPCGNVIKISCESKGIENLTIVKFLWKMDCGKFREVLSSDTDDIITVELVPDNGDPVTTIKVTILIAELSNKNYFNLFGIIEADEPSLEKLLSRGVIYTEI